jgi:hypothetical protein
MSLAWELGLTNGRNCLYASHINLLENVNERVDEIVSFLKSNDTLKVFRLDEGPCREELGRGVSHAIVSNPHITTVIFSPHAYAQTQDLIHWISARETLRRMRNLEMIDMHGADGMSAQDWNFLFHLLSTCMSLKELHVYFTYKCEDAVIHSIARYLGNSSLTKFSLLGCISMSDASFHLLCNGVAESSLRTLTLGSNVIGVAHLETAAEYLACAIVKSSFLEEVQCSIPHWALERTTPVKSMDFCFLEIDGSSYWTRFRINRTWKALLSANIPESLWPRILEKAHAFPETSHGPVGILYRLLRDKPDLVP